LEFCKPYWFRLSIGIFFGLIVGGSLFGSLLIVPKMMMALNKDSGKQAA